MQSLKEYLGCQCRFHGLPPEGLHAYTFPWAKTQYGDEKYIWPVHQSLELNVNIEKEEISGVTTLDFKVHQKEIDFFKLNAVDLRIHDVQFWDKGQFTAVKFSTASGLLTVYPPQKLLRGQQGKVKVVYSAVKPKAGLYFVKPDKEYPHRDTQVWTQGQHLEAPYWFPCVDDPDVKFTFEIQAEVPAGFIATSNGAKLSEVKGGKTTTFHWKTQFQLPAYLVTLTVGKFSEIKEDWRGKPITYLFEKGRDQEAKVSFGKTTKMLELFSQKIGVDYPYEKYAQIAVSEFPFGGMENTSATTQTDATLHPLEIDEDFSSDDLVSHELAHQWFGDLVTCKTWGHGWLNEGWATFMEYVFKENDLGLEECDYYRFEELQIYLGEAAEYKRPLVTNFYSDPNEVWDRHTYQKAALIMQTLKKQVGDDDFWTATKKYLEAHRGGVVETVDFQRAMESVSGQNLQRFFDQWIFKPDHPELKAEFSWDDKTKMACFKLSQSQKTEFSFELKTELEFHFEGNKALKFPIVFNDKEQRFYFSLPEKPSYLIFDRGNHLLKTMDWSIPEEMIGSQLNRDKDVVGKIWAMKALSKEGTGLGIELLTERLKTDEFWGVRAMAAEYLGETRARAAFQVLKAALKEEKKAKVRVKICSALGNFKTDEAGEVLMTALDKDPNIFVQGSAATALGKTRHPKAFEKLKQALDRSSWHDYIRAQAFTGIKNLHTDEALPLFLDGGKYGAPKFARMNAISALSDYGYDRSDVREYLISLLDDPFLRVRFAAIQALVGRRESAATEALELVAHRDPNGQFKAVAFRGANRIREMMKKPAEFQDLRERLDKIVDENRKLQDRLDKLESKP